VEPSVFDRMSEGCVPDPGGDLRADRAHRYKDDWTSISNVMGLCNGLVSPVSKTSAVYSCGRDRTLPGLVPDSADLAVGPLHQVWP